MVAVALAPVQAEFGVTRGDASLPYTLTMLGFGLGGIVMGRLADRFGVVVPVSIGALGLVQIAATAIVALVAASLADSFDVPAVRGAVVAWAVVWFVLGYALYATVFGTHSTGSA